MPIQTVGDYPEQLGLAIEGQFADLSPATRVTGVNESAAMPFGRVVQFDSTGTIDRSVKLSDTALASLKMYGITGFTQSQTKTGVALTGVAQVTTVTVGGTASDGNYDIIVDGFLARVVRSTTPASNDDIATALRAAINADAALALRVVASGATDAVIITKLDAGSFSVDTAETTATGTLTAALTTGGAQNGIFQNEPANILRKGTIWVRPETAVTPASGVFFRITANAGVGTALGALTGTDDGANTEDISAFASWMTSSEGGAAGALAKLVINLD